MVGHLPSIHLLVGHPITRCFEPEFHSYTVIVAWSPNPRYFYSYLLHLVVCTPEYVLGLLVVVVVVDDFKVRRLSICGGVSMPCYYGYLLELSIFI